VKQPAMLDVTLLFADGLSFAWPLTLCPEQSILHPSFTFSPSGHAAIGNSRSPVLASCARVFPELVQRLDRQQI